MITGKVIDKGTNDTIPGVAVILSDANGESITSASGGVQGTLSDIDGNYTADIGPGEYATFSMVGYPKVTKSYADLQANSRVVMDDEGGTGLPMFEVLGFAEDTKNVSRYQWAIYTGVGILLFVILYIVGKRQGWW